MIVHDTRTGGAARLTNDGGSWRLAPSGDAPDAGLYAGRGWVDIQVNGFGGHDVNDGTLDPDGFADATRLLHAQGVTRWLPTVITASPEHMARCLAAIAAARSASPWVARAVPAIHLEGPFLSDDDGARGAHPQAHVRDPDLALFDELQAAAGGLIRLVTLAPERAGSEAFIRELVGRGIVVALGHTVAGEAAIERAVAAGASLSTHLGNGAPAQLPRHPNMIWTQLADDRLHASVIFDGHHLPASVMRVLYRVKGDSRLILTSDAVALAGRPPGIYHGQVGGDVELHPSGRLTLLGTPYLAGSASSLLDGVVTATVHLGLPIGDVMRMAGDTPADLLGVRGEDVTVVRAGRNAVEVVAVIVGGEMVIDRRSA